MGRSIEEIAKYYDENDTSEMMREQIEKGNYYVAKPKRITMNISQQIYDEAQALNGQMLVGYQNVLKTAMLLGLKSLRELLSKEISPKKKNKKKK